MTLTDDEITTLAQVGRHNRSFVDLVARLRQTEMERMALTTPENFCTLKGRVQVLTELLQQIRL